MALEIDISNFSFRHWQHGPAALSNISLSVRAGEICALLGPTNAGKTTLLHALAGVLGSHHPQSTASGQIRVGEHLYEPLPRSVLFPTVGLTIQEPYYQISGLRDSVLEEVALSLETIGFSTDEAANRTIDLLRKMGLEHLAGRKPFALSGGELQRVALATILAVRPAVLLMDEPCNSLDGGAQQRLATLIRSLRGTATILIADYQIDVALKTADKFIVMSGGTVVFCGDRDLFLAHLSDFRSILPVSGWIEIQKALKGQSVDRRVARLAGIS